MDKLKWLLDYELNQSIRYRRFLSLVMLAPKNGDNRQRFRSILDDFVRCSDPIFSINGTLAIVMGETDKKGAVKAMERYQETINNVIEVRYSVATFPEDAKDAETLIHTAQRRLETAQTLENEIIVFRDRLYDAG